MMRELDPSIFCPRPTVTYPRLSIVVPSFNSRETLAGLIESLVHQTAKPRQFELIVVDDGSTDRTSEWLARQRLPYDLDVVRFATNGGCSRSRNAGVERARAALILFLDADMLCGPAVVEKHLSAHEQTRDRAVVGRVLTHPSVRRTPLARWFDSKNPSSQLAALRPTRFITQNLSIPASLLRDVGGFDECFSAYGIEDIELGLRLSGIPGYELCYAPEALAYHCQNLDFTAKLDKVRRTGQFNLAHLSAKFPAEMASLPLGRLVRIPGESPRWSKRVIQAALSCPMTETLLRWAAERLPDGSLNLRIVDFLFAQALLRGYRESQPDRVSLGVLQQHGRRI
jgi:GT2 family glycosyltransferase